MGHVDVINRIIEAEQRARQIASEAREKQNNLSVDLQNEEKNMRETYRLRAVRRIEKVAEREKALLQEQMDAMEKHFEEELSKMEKHYAENRDAWAEKLFLMIVGK